MMLNTLATVHGDLGPPSWRRDFEAQKGPHFPSLAPDRYRILGPADPTYDCLGIVTLLAMFNIDPTVSSVGSAQLARGVAERNQISSTIKLDRTLKVTDFLQYCLVGQDQHFGQLGFTRQVQPDMSFSSNRLKIPIYITNRPDFRNFHVAIQSRNGEGWISKMGAIGPLVLHTSATDIVGPVFEKVVAVYEGAMPDRLWTA